MRVLYIGHYGYGSTSRMRGEILKTLLQADAFTVIDIDIPVNATPRFYRSLGWRCYIGPLISNINRCVLSVIEHGELFDVIWIDKGVYIRPRILSRLKAKSSKLIHYTPDTAFRYNRSKLFFDGIHLYDYCITTKSFEIETYSSRGAKEILFCTQGYDPGIHHPYHDFSEKKGVCFVGLYESWRAACIQVLLERGIYIKLAGHGWASFVKKNSHFKHFDYYGEGLFGEAYAKLISGSLVGLGFLSKKFPELHTTRTFEIPACGTILVTERNEEISKFYNDDEVIFFKDIEPLPEKIITILGNEEKLRELSRKGYEAVRRNHYEYKSILSDLLKEMNLLN